MAQIVTAQFVGQTSCGFVREKYYEIEIHSMKRPCRTLLTILAIIAIDVLFFYGLLWILKAISMIEIFYMRERGGCYA